MTMSAAVMRLAFSRPASKSNERSSAPEFLIEKLVYKNLGCAQGEASVWRHARVCLQTVVRQYWLAGDEDWREVMPAGLKK
jgi:hypothetical protein